MAWRELGEGGPLRALAVVAWAAPASTGTGVGGPGRPDSRVKGHGGATEGCGEVRGGEEERGGHGAGSCGDDTPRPLADHGAPDQELGPLRCAAKFDELGCSPARRRCGGVREGCREGLHFESRMKSTD